MGVLASPTPWQWLLAGLTHACGGAGSLALARMSRIVTAMTRDDEQPRAIEVLLIKDNAEDIRITKQALTAGKVANHLHCVTDGVEALEFLQHKGKHTAAPRPDLILLDLNLPRKDGREVLAAIKQDPRTKQIPVVILTASKAEEDVLRSYQLHANSYVTKPVDFEKFVAVVNSIERFWLTVVTLPPSG